MRKLTKGLDMSQLTLSQTIENVQSLIDSGNGDPGRLYHILECLKNNKPLYHSDQNYLEKKLESSFSLEDKPEPATGSDVLPRIQELMNTGIGDPGRLQHIYDMISNNKTLYHSDVSYLESKLNESVSPQPAEPETLPKQTEYIPPPPPPKPAQIGRAHV